MNEEDLKNLIKIKDSEICLSKAVTHDSTDVVVYFIDKIPYFFRIEKDEQLLPTGTSIQIEYNTQTNKTTNSNNFIIYILSLLFMEVSKRA